MQEYHIKTEADRLGTSIEIDKIKGKITLKGLGSDVNEVYLEAKELLFAAKKEKEDTEKEKILAEKEKILAEKEEMLAKLVSN